MTTKELLFPPAEFPRARAYTPSQLTALKGWAEVLQPPELEAYRISRDAIPDMQSQKPSLEPSKRWSDQKFMEFALNAEYPDDIEERIEESWRR